MATGANSAGYREATVIIAAAIVLAALLELVVLEQYSEERLATLAVIVGLFVVLLWVGVGGYARAATWWEVRTLRLHVSKHPEIVAQLRALVLGVDEVLGDRRQTFHLRAVSVLADWDRVSSEGARIADAPPRFSVGEQSQRNQAGYLVGAFASHTQMWPMVRNTATRLIDDGARDDGYDFSTAAELLGTYIATARSYIGNFTLSMRQAGAGKLSVNTLAEWATWATKVNALLDEAERIARISPEKTGFGVSLTFERIEENLAYVPEKKTE